MNALTAPSAALQRGALDARVPMNDFVRPDPKKPATLKGLLGHMIGLHDCVHDGFRDTKKAIADLAEVVNDDRAETRRAVARLEKAVANVARTVGAQPVHEKGQKRPARSLGQLKQWEAYLRLGSAVGGVLVLYKVFEPVIVAGAVALRHALLNL